MAIKPLSAQGFKPSHAQGFLHPWARLVLRLFSSLSRLPWLFCIRSNRRSIRNSQFEIRNPVRLFSHPPRPPCSRALLFLLSLALLLLCSPTVVHAQPGWGPDERLVFWPGGSYSPKIVGSDSMMHVVWWGAFSDSTGGYDEVFYKRSTDEGTTWGPEIMLSTKDNKTSNAQEIAVYGQDVHVVWHDYGIGTMCRRSSDEGVSWGAIDTLLGNDLTGHASIAAVGESVYVVADAPSQGWNVYTLSTDRGVTWSPYRIISYRESQRIPFSVHPPFLHIAKDPWDSTAQAPKVYYLRSTDGGRTWGQDTLISDTDSAGSQIPSLSVDYRGSPHVTWFDYRYSPYPQTGDIFYTTSSDYGATWVSPDSLTVVHRAVGSSILAQGDTLHLVWEDDRNGFDTNFEMYYRMSTNLGITWGPEVRLTNDPRRSIGPNLGLSRNYLHLVWEDNRGDSIVNPYVVYYKRKTKASGVETWEISSGSAIKSNILMVHPNPMQSFCEVQVNGAQVGQLAIYDVIGRLLRDLTPHASRLTPHVFLWDGRDDKGKEVRSGIYFIRARTGSCSETQKIILMR